MEADAVTAKCMSNQEGDEDYCYVKGNDAGIKCMEGCPCAKDCPNGCIDCHSHIGEEVCNDGDIAPEEQCRYVWGSAADACKADCVDMLSNCTSTCGDSGTPEICEDDCDADYVKFLEDCPCHTNCPNGCACPPEDTFGNQYCPTLPIADPDCLEDFGEISQECRDSCTNDAYLCVSKCYGETDCIDVCLQRENICVNHCPCYPQCPSGCPCWGWCENTPPPIEYQCSKVWGEEAEECEGDRRAEMDECEAKCETDPYPQICEDKCADKYAEDIKDCPCHTNCKNGCRCPEEDVLGNSYCGDGYKPDEECLEEHGDISQACRNHCTTEAFICANTCAGIAECLDGCKDKENVCIFNCPCYEGCLYPENPNCDPPMIDQCKAIWGEENAACEADRKTDLATCLGGCDDAICEDGCNTVYTEDTMDCPCHTDCPNGCACPLENELGNSYCPPTPIPDEDCLEAHGDISQNCRNDCTNSAYRCTVMCDNDPNCIHNCRLDENICVSRCPCYPECPLGCPCPGWCNDEPNKCEVIWGDANKQCTADCRAQRDDCLSGCDESKCEDECNRQYLEECSYYCPCHTYCPNGCSCPPSNDLGNSYCPPNIPDPDPDCLEQDSNSDISKQCRNQCTDLAFTCWSGCYGDPDCEAICRADDIECINKCPCYPECPDGCPCPNWCGNPDVPSPIEKCGALWGDEAQECIDDCKDVRDKCLGECGGDALCEDKCNNQYLIECSYYCPCHTYCPNGCPCYHELGQQYCPGGPDNIPDPNCIDEHHDIEEECRDQCTDKSWDCIKICVDDNCATKCEIELGDCTEVCPCHKVLYLTNRQPKIKLNIFLGMSRWMSMPNLVSSNDDNHNDYSKIDNHDNHYYYYYNHK